MAVSLFVRWATDTVNRAETDGYSVGRPRALESLSRALEQKMYAEINREGPENAP